LADEKPSTTFRRAKRAEADQIQEFIRRTYGKSAKHILSRWPWQFLHNPQDQGDTIPVYIALQGGEVVGITSAIPILLQIGDAMHEAEWSCEMMVDPRCRGQGLGLGLTKVHADTTPIFVAVRMAPSTRYIEGKIGCVPFDPVWIYVRFAGVTRRAVYEYVMMRTVRRKRIHALARVLCRVFHADAAVAFLLNSFRFLRDRLRGFPRTHGVEVEEVERFGPEVDALWERVRGQYGVIAKRDSEFLNWKAFDHPFLGYRGFLARRGGDVVGYSVLRVSQEEEPSVGHIIDLFTAREDREARDALIQHAIGVFGKSRAVVQCEATVPELQQALRRHGFLRVNSIVPNFRCNDPAMHAELDRRKSEWFITRIDQDLDQLRPMWAAGVRL